VSGELNFLIRGAEERDLPGLFPLARLLDSYNLPADRRRLRALIRDSRRSFACRPATPARAKYLFLLEDLAAEKIAGCSLIIGKHGTPGLPHLYLSSYAERRRSRTLRRTVEHRCFRLGATEDGPTEVGGLVLLPAYRARPEKLGRRLSFVRFLYMAARPERFQNRVLAEFMPAFLSRGRSPFWEYFGRKFTKLSYHRADRLSIDNKEFILSLFPRSVIYQDFFPRRIIRYLGRVGDPSLPAARLLRRAGFRYLNQIEPFDGGPYYGAARREISVVRRSRRRTAAAGPVRGPAHLVLSERGGSVRCVAAPLRPGGAAELSAEALRLLGTAAGEDVWTAPLR
jgi:arginine N-succinyltransferase